MATIIKIIGAVILFQLNENMSKPGLKPRTFLFLLAILFEMSYMDDITDKTTFSQKSICKGTWSVY